MCTCQCQHPHRISVLRIATSLPSLPASAVLHAHLLEHSASGGAAAALVPGPAGQQDEGEASAVQALMFACLCAAPWTAERWIPCASCYLCSCVSCAPLQDEGEASAVQAAVFACLCAAPCAAKLVGML
eukprot:scaffold98675_cov21-Tisochrysis_lutea.AAC.1